MSTAAWVGTIGIGGGLAFFAFLAWWEARKRNKAESSKKDALALTVLKHAALMESQDKVKRLEALRDSLNQRLDDMDALLAASATPESVRARARLILSKRDSSN